MLNKRYISTGILALALLMPVSEAKAQGWPIFDVAKLASQITNLVGRFQPVPQVLSRVNQVKSTLEQIKAAGQAAMSGDLKSLGKQASGALKSDVFSKKKTPADKAAEGSDSNGSALASAKIKDVYYIIGGEKAQGAIEEVAKARQTLNDDTKDFYSTKTLHAAMNAAKDAGVRVKAIDDAMANATTLHDNVNANTIALMANNFEKLNRITLLVAEMSKNTTGKILQSPMAGFEKPELPKLEGVEGNLVVKDEINVDL